MFRYFRKCFVGHVIDNNMNKVYNIFSNMIRFFRELERIGYVMKKMLTVAILSFGLIFSASASALEANTDGSTVSINFDSNERESTMVFVVRSGGNIDNNDDLYAIKLVRQDENGNMTIEFNMPDARITALQRYDVYTRDNDKASLQGSFAYATSDMKTNFLENLNAATTQSELTALIDPDNPENTETGITSIYSKQDSAVILEAIGVDVESFYSLTDKQRLQTAGIMVNSSYGTFTDTKSAASALNSALAVAMINASQDASTVLSKCDFGFEGKKFSEISNSDEKTWICDYINENGSYDKTDDLAEAYKTANQLYKINNTRFDSLEKVLKSYAEDMGLSSMTGYKSYKALKSKTSTNEKIVESLKKEPALTVDELDAVIKKSVTKSSEGKGSGGSGGGSGSGGSGNSQTAGMVRVPTPTVTPDVTSEETVKPMFKDMGNAEWARAAVEKMATSGIIAGDGDGNFRPDDKMTREEYVKMIVCAANMYNPDAKCSFDDVPQDAWYYSYVASGFDSGIVLGRSEAEFGVGSPLTRQDMVVIAARAAEKIKDITPIREEEAFDDADEISEYAKAYVTELYRAGVVNGFDGKKFGPSEFATRAQGALVIYKLFLD